MPTLHPPPYPENPEAPLLGFGLSFSEEISRSVVGAVARHIPDRPHETDIRVAAALTMFEAFLPNDHLGCMMSAQGVGLHAAVMDNLERAMQHDTPLAMVIKLRANAVQLSRGFSVMVRDMERRQGKPPPAAPSPPPPAAPSPPPPAAPSPAPPEAGPAPRPPSRAARTKAAPAAPAKAKPAPEPAATEPAPEQAATELPPEQAATEPPPAPDLPEDLVTRPDGTPGSFAAYVPEIPALVYPHPDVLLMAEHDREPKAWRQVDASPALAAEPRPGDLPRVAVSPPPGKPDKWERMVTGDAMARFCSTRFDPDAPPQRFYIPDEEESVVELEIVSTGGDPEAEAERAAIMAAHPEGKPIVTFRYGAKPPAKEPPDG